MSSVPFERVAKRYVHAAGAEGAPSITQRAPPIATRCGRSETATKLAEMAMRSAWADPAIDPRKHERMIPSQAMKIFARCARRATMPSYVILYRMTPEGARALRDTVKRAGQVRQQNARRGFKIR